MRNKSKGSSSHGKSDSQSTQKELNNRSGDFGVPESDVAARNYVSENTKRADPGASVPRSGSQGLRTSGVGGNDSGDGSSSGGDLDPDIIGLGTGGGVSTNGNIHEPPGPDEAS